MDIVTRIQIIVRLNKVASPAGHLTTHDKRMVRELVRRTDPNSHAVGTSTRGKRVGWVDADRNPADGYGVYVRDTDGYVNYATVTVVS